MTQDLRHALRSLLRTPGFTLAALLTLALGVGANTTIFSLLSGILVHPLPYADPDRLVQVGPIPRGALPILRTENRTLENVGGYVSSATEFNVLSNREPERLSGGLVSPDLFPTLGIQPLLGRLFLPDEDTPGRDNVVLLSYAFWQSRLAGDPRVIGTHLSVDGMSREVIGVMRPDCDFPDANTRLWLPLRLDSNNRGEMWSTYIALVGRVRAGVSFGQANTDFNRLIPRIQHSFPWRMPDSRGNFLLNTMQPLKETMVRNVRARLWILFGAVSLILMIACANVANLLVVRSAGRAGEIAIRAALGGSRFRILRRLMVENLILAVGGAALGWLVASLGVEFAIALLPSKLRESRT